MPIDMRTDYWYNNTGQRRNSHSIYLRIERGSDLAVRDRFRGSSDPYVVVFLGGQRKKTRVKKQTLNPVWQEDMEFEVGDLPQTIRFEVYDKDTFSRDDPMGSCELNLKGLFGCWVGLG